MKYIAVLPARGGSQRIPKKNIADIGGEPALGITIAKISSFRIFESIYVSTDSEEIANIAEGYGAVAFPLRKKELSDDRTPSEAVIRDFIEEHSIDLLDTAVCCIYPLSILVTKEYLETAISLLASNHNSFIISASKFENNPLRHSFVVSNGGIKIVNPNYNAIPSQEVPDCYFDVGMFYLARTNIWLDPRKYWYEDNASIVEIPSELAIDVDTFRDLNKLKNLFLAKH